MSSEHVSFLETQSDSNGDVGPHAPRSQTIDSDTSLTLDILHSAIEILLKPVGDRIRKPVGLLLYPVVWQH